MKKFLSIVLIIFLGYAVSNAQPVLTSVTPSSGNPGQSLTVTITGSGTSFIMGSGISNVQLIQSSTTINAATWSAIDNTNMTADFVLPFAGVGGDYDVVVSYFGPPADKLPQGFFINGRRVTAMNPDTTKRGMTLSATIYGTLTNFAQGSQINTIRLLKPPLPPISPTSFFSINDTAISATFNINPPDPTGLYDLEVNG